MPTLYEQFLNFLETSKDVFIHAVRFGQIIDQEKAIERFKICEKCRKFNGGRCGSCGCFMFLKLILIASKCKENKWKE